MLLWLLRVCFVALMVGVAGFAFMFFNTDVQGDQGGGFLSALAAASTILAVGGLVLLTDVKEKNKQITTISAVYFGLLLGLLLGWLFSLAIEPIARSLGGNLPEALQFRLGLITRVTITVICCYVSISTLLQTKDEFRFIIPYVEFSKQVKGGRPLVLDTSVIIDGRLADVCDTRLVDTKLIVPRFVLQELQAIADSSDKMKRNRGRRGLDILKRLQTNPKVELLMHDGNVPELRTGEKIRVDERLVIFAKSVGARVVMNVINLNEVANALKTVALPGEFMQVKVVKVGDQPGQGVGYLDDGTMVVIEQGRNQVGQEVSLVVTSVLQTPAGRMIFGRIESRPSGAFAPVSPGTGPHAPVPPGTGQHAPVQATSDTTPSAAVGTGYHNPVRKGDKAEPPRG